MFRPSASRVLSEYSGAMHCEYSGREHRASRALSWPESRYAGDALCTGAAGSVEIALAQAAQCVNR